MKTFEDLGFTRENMGDNFSPRMIRYTHKSYKDNDVSKLEYLYYEYFDKKKENIDVMYSELRDSFNSFNNKHLNLYNVLLLEKQ